MSLAAPLLAQGDWIGVLVFIVIAIISILSQVLGKAKEAPRPRQRPRRPVQAGGGQRAPGQNVDDEINDFLRRAAQRHRGQVQPEAVDELVEADLVEDQPVGDGMKTHVDEYLDTQEFERQSAELGRRVVSAEQQLEGQIRQKFQHEVSGLAAKKGETAMPPGDLELPPITETVRSMPPTVAAGLAAMLSDTQNIRQAIVLSEIINRPEHRWS